MNSCFARAIALLAVVLALPALAGTPSSGTVSPSATRVTYTVGPFTQSNPTPIPNTDVGPRCNATFPCDSFALTVTVPPGYNAANPAAKVRVTTAWSATSASDYDLYIYSGTRGDLNGTLVAEVGKSSTSANPEVFEFRPVDGASTTYTIKVVPYAVTPGEAVTGTIELLAAAPDACEGVVAASVNGGSRVSKSMVDTLASLPLDSQYGAYVHFTAGSAAQHRALLESVGLRVAYDFERHASAVFAAGPVSGFRALLAIPDVTDIRPNQPIRFLGETAPWATRSRVAQEPVSGGPYSAADGQVLHGNDVTVVVIDTGLNATHRDFEGRVMRNYKIVGDPIFAPETIQVFDLGPNSDTDTTSGHGTHVTGIVGGSGLESTGNYPFGTAPNIRGTFTGAAPAARLIAYSVGEAPDPGLLGVGTLIYVDAALAHTLDTYDSVSPKIRAVSLSLGDGPGSLYSPTSVSSCVVKGLVKKGTNVVFAASNDGGTGSADMTSSFCKDPTPGVICVASYDDGETGKLNGALSSFSSRGKLANPNTYPDIAAPGSNITATCVQPAPGQTTCATGAETRWAPYYGTISGTSMATPHVSGVVALIAQARPLLTPAQIEDALQDAARKVSTNGVYEPDPQNTGGTHNFGFGAGLLDLPVTLDALGVSKPGLSVGGNEVVIIDVDSDPNIAGAADVLKLTMQEGTVGTETGITYRLTLRNALDFSGSPDGVTYQVLQNVNGAPVNRTIKATALAVAGGATRAGNVVSLFVAYNKMLYPPVGAPIHNIKVDVIDVASGAFLDAAPSPANSTGESAQQQPMFGKPFTVRLAAALPPPVYEDTCTIPGITLFTDPDGDDNPPLPTADNGQGDLLSLQVSEPTNEPTKLVFTLKMRSLAGTLPPNVNWYVIFNGPPKGTNTTGKWHVEMRSNDTSTAAFAYGRYSPANQNLSQGPDTANGDQTSAVAMLGSSYNAATGIITLKVNKSNFNLSDTNRDLKTISGVVYQLVGASSTGSLQIIDQGAGISTYRTRLAGDCPNTVTTPALSAVPTSGTAPLGVSFTAAATDAEGDSIVEYSFDFGDGASVSQTTNTAIHTYQNAGTFPATLRVRDSRGLQSLPSAPVEITVIAPNTAPIAALSATPRQGAAPLSVSFDASGSSDPDPGDTITSFTMSFGDGTAPETSNTPSFSHTYTQPGVYTAQLFVTDSRARQSANTAEVQIDVDAMASETVPGAPTIGTATPGDGQASISFAPPANDGGRPITSYTVTCNPGGITATGGFSPITVTGLTNDTPYDCSVTATNSVGTGPASASVGVTPKAAAAAPGAPTITTATPGDGRATIAFTAPANNGGSAIVFYTARCTPGPFTGNATGSPITVTDLVNGVTYSCSVTATNSAGTSPPSASVTVTPAAAPAPGSMIFGDGFEDL